MKFNKSKREAWQSNPHATGGAGGGLAGEQPCGKGRGSWWTAG